MAVLEKSNDVCGLSTSVYWGLLACVPVGLTHEGADHSLHLDNKHMIIMATTVGVTRPHPRPNAGALCATVIDMMELWTSARHTQEPCRPNMDNLSIGYNMIIHSSKR